MVFFTCDSCGESLKKNAVDKHVLTRCRSARKVTCIDCNQDFWGDSYQGHTRCLTEDQKYAPAGSRIELSKGQQKQDEWMGTLQRAIKQLNVEPAVRSLLNQLIAFDNVPRKKQKFRNFVRSALKVSNDQTAEKLWSALETVRDAERESKGESNGGKEEPDEKEKKKSRKTKRETIDGTTEEEPPEKQRKKKRDTEKLEPNTNGLTEKESTASSEQRQKFDWMETITTLLRAAPDQTLPVKKLKKKVINHYLATVEECHKTREEIEARLIKRINKNPTLKLHKDRVKLKV